MKKERGIIQLFLCIGFLVVFCTMGAPWLEKNAMSKTQKEIIEIRDLDPTGLFYTESEEAIEAYFWLSNRED